MKKLIFFFLIFLFIILLQGCEMFVFEEDSEAFRELSSRYNQYVTDDIVQFDKRGQGVFHFDNFKKVANNATHIASTSVFMVETNGLNILNQVVSEKYGTGTLIHIDDKYMYILTTFEMIDLKSRKVHYEISDVYGDNLTAERFAFDEALGLALLRVRHTSKIYPVVDFPSYFPLSNELVLMISNNYPTQNIHKFGYYLNQDGQSYIETVSTAQATGSPVFNLKLEVIGIQQTYDQSHVSLIDYETILSFIDANLPTKTKGWCECLDIY